LVLIFQGQVRPWRARWESFLADHSEWWGRAPHPDPVYWLPEQVVDRLARTVTSEGKAHRDRPALLTPAEANAEHAFRKCCLSFGGSVVGVWEGTPVSYEPLARLPSVTVSEEQIREMGWDRFGTGASLRDRLETVQRKAEGARHQQIAFAGWLTFLRPYQEDKERLTAQWANLGVALPWPLLANTADREPTPVLRAEIDPGRILPAEASDFLEAATRFMRKWKLARMATWDLPLPQGPLEHVPLGLARHILGPDDTGVFFPGYFDIPSAQDVRAEIRERQDAAAREAGLGAEFPLTDLTPRAGSASAWENAFQLWFVERAVLQRYAGRRGLTSRLVEAIADMLDCSEDRVKQLRGLYRPSSTPA
jgi:hypothetical protein